MAKNAEIVEEINDGNVYLRKISKKDVIFLFNSLNNENLTKFLSLGPLKSLEHSKRLIKGYLKYWESYIQFNYIIELKSNRMEKIGSISIWNINWKHLRGQIGIWLAPLYWKKGFGKKALIMIKDIAFHYLKLNRLEAYVATENRRSIHLFESCNFHKEGLLKQYLKFNGMQYDAFIMASLKEKE
ncbi:MAG: GNAT family N-acetyltransferase [Promethearchaeota archaeon]